MKPIKARAIGRSVVKHRGSSICGSDQQKLVPIDEVGGKLNFIGLTWDGMEKKLSLTADGRSKQFQPDARRVSDLVEPTGVRAIADVLIFGVAPAKGVRARGNIKSLLLPVYLTREAVGLEIAIDIKLKEIEIGFRRNSPPETEPARAGDAGAQPRVLIIVNMAALGGGNAIMSHGGFTEPLSVAPGDPTEIGIVEKLASKTCGYYYCYGDRLRTLQPQIVCHIERDGCVARLVEWGGFQSPGLIGILEDNQVGVWQKRSV